MWSDSRTTVVSRPENDSGMVRPSTPTGPAACRVASCGRLPPAGVDGTAGRLPSPGRAGTARRRGARSRACSRGWRQVLRPLGVVERVDGVGRLHRRRLTPPRLACRPRPSKTTTSPGMVSMTAPLKVSMDAGALSPRVPRKLMIVSNAAPQSARTGTCFDLQKDLSRDIGLDPGCSDSDSDSPKAVPERQVLRGQPRRRSD